MGDTVFERGGGGSSRHGCCMGAGFEFDFVLSHRSISMQPLLIEAHPLGKYKVHWLVCGMARSHLGACYHTCGVLCVCVCVSLLGTTP